MTNGAITYLATQTFSAAGILSMDIQTFLLLFNLLVVPAHITVIMTVACCNGNM